MLQHTYAIEPLRPVPRGAKSLAAMLVGAREDALLLTKARAELVIADGDPIGLIAAKSKGIPSIAVGHNVVFTRARIPGAPRAVLAAERLNSALSTQPARWAVGANFVPLTPKDARTTIGRPDPRWHTPPAVRDDGFVLSYFRDGQDGGAVDAAATAGLSVRVYGARPPSTHPNVTFLPASEEGFAADLARCSAVIATGGSNLIGEAVYLGKPIFCVYGRQDFEQRLNVHMLDAAKLGDGRALANVCADDVHLFLTQVAAGAFDTFDLAASMPTVSDRVVDWVNSAGL